MRYGWTFDVVDDMSFDQIDIAWSRAKKSKGITVASAEEAIQVTREWREYAGV